MLQLQAPDAAAIELLPEIPVEHRATGGGAPALAFPAREPFLQAVDQIAAVGADHQARIAGQLPQLPQQGQSRSELHAVVGGGALSPSQFVHGTIGEAQQGTPAPGAGITAAGAITGRCHHLRWPLSRPVAHRPPPCQVRLNWGPLPAADPDAPGAPETLPCSELTWPWPEVPWWPRPQPGPWPASD